MDKFVVRSKKLKRPLSDTDTPHASTSQASTSHTSTPHASTSHQPTDHAATIYDLTSDVSTSPPLASQASTSQASTSHAHISLHDSPQAPSQTSQDQPSKKIRKKQVLLFYDRWLEMSMFKGWLIKSSNRSGQIVAKCKYCNLELANHKSVLEKHISSSRHTQTLALNTGNKTIMEVMNKPANRMVKRAELKLAAYHAERNLAFVHMDTLIPLLSDIFPECPTAQGLAMGRTKATAIVTQVLGPEFSTSLHNLLKKPGCYFSLILDETTDVSSKKQCAITVIYCDDDFNIKTSFLDMVEPESSSAESIFNSLKSCIEDKNIPISNFVGFSSDTTNSMVGEHNSVFSRLKTEFPYMVCVKCSCHSIHLAASKACLHLPRSLEDTLRNIGSHFSRSDKRQRKLREMQEFYSVSIHKILSPANTRWLSLKECVDRTLEQLPALIPYFTAEVFEDPSKTTEEILSNIKNELMIIYLEFMSYTLELLTKFNKLFQSEVPLLHRLEPEVKRLLKIIYAKYLKFEITKQDPLKINHELPENFLSIDKLYLGVKAAKSIEKFLEKNQNSLAQSEIHKIKLACTKFYIEVAGQIKTRFNFSDPVFSFIHIVDPPYAQSYETKELSAVIQRFPFVEDSVDLQSLDMEWMEHALLDHESLELDKNLPASQYWKKVFALKNNEGGCKFPNLMLVISLLLVLPFSNASVERTFSNLTRIKTDSRNSLKTETVAALMATKNGLKDHGGVVQFEPTNAMLAKTINYNPQLH